MEKINKQEGEEETPQNSEKKKTLSPPHRHRDNFKTSPILKSIFLFSV